MRSPFFSGWGKRFWKGATAREVFKFALYVSIPLMSSVVYANPEVMRDLILRLRFVEYPEAAPRPPVGHEIDAFRAKISKVRENKKQNE